MIATRRMRERIAAERAGVPPPVPRTPDEISYQQHVTEMRDLRRAHAAEVAVLKGRLAELEARTQAKQAPEPAAKPAGAADRDSETVKDTGKRSPGKR